MNEPASGTADHDLTKTPAQTADELTQSRALSQSGTSRVPVAAGYRLQHRLGEGAYGAVWLAREQKTGKQVAIKFDTHRRGIDWSLLSREIGRAHV